MNAPNKAMTLQQLIDSKSDLVGFFRNDVVSPHSVFKPSLSPVPQEWSNWRDEQRAWRNTAILFDQTHHMPELFIKGPDSLALLNSIGVNSLSNFGPNKARQFVGCNHRGQFIGESILYYLDKDEFELVSGMFLQNWVRFQAQSGQFNVTLRHDLTTNENPNGRTKFRFGMDGPNAETIFKEVVEGGAPEIPFFNTARIRVAGCDVMALRHGMAGHKGVEISGRFGDYEKIKAVLLDAGRAHGLRQGGMISYYSTVGENGWMAYPVPGIFTGDDMRSYREWLPADSWEGRLQLGGSFVSPNIEDYYVTPWDMGYDKIVKFDHDFIGREALENSGKSPQRTAVCLVWHHDDVMKLFRSMLEPDITYKTFNLPSISYSWQQNDEVRSANGDLVGVAAYSGYTINEHEVLSLAIIGREYAQPGTELLLTWGEPDGGSRKQQVERHRQMQVRVKVAPKPFPKAVQEMKRAGLG